MSRQRILFVKHYSTNAKFILNDIEILKEKYDVEVYTAHTKKNVFIIFSLLKQFFHLLFNFYKYSLIYIWFGDYHSFIPVMMGKLFGIRTVIAIGGYDATDIPEIDCGAFNEDNFRKKIRSRMLRYSLKNADRLLVVDDSLIINTNTYIYSDIKGKAPLKDGILNFIPGIENRIEVVYTGFDEDFFKTDSGIAKENFILSVGYSPNDNEFRRKGFDMLIKAAEEMKDTEFVIVGLNKEQINNLRKKNLNNLKVYSYVGMEELKNFYLRAKVFAQLSLFEGQPNSLCEAMMYECIPVGSDVNGIPRVIGNTGFIVAKKDVNEICGKLYSALKASGESGKEIRRRITENFSLKKRSEKILSVAEDIINSERKFI